MLNLICSCNIEAIYQRIPNLFLRLSLGSDINSPCIDKYIYVIRYFNLNLRLLNSVGDLTNETIVVSYEHIVPFGMEGSIPSENRVHHSSGWMSITVLHHCHLIICIPNDSTTTTWRNICHISRKIAHFYLLQRTAYNSTTSTPMQWTQISNKTSRRKNQIKSVDNQSDTGAKYALPYLPVNYAIKETSYDLDIELRHFDISNTFYSFVMYEFAYLSAC